MDGLAALRCKRGLDYSRTNPLAATGETAMIILQDAATPANTS